MARREKYPYGAGYFRLKDDEFERVLDALYNSSSSRVDYAGAGFVGGGRGTYLVDGLPVSKNTEWRCIIISSMTSKTSDGAIDRVRGFLERISGVELKHSKLMERVAMTKPTPSPKDLDRLSARR